MAGLITGLKHLAETVHGKHQITYDALISLAYYAEQLDLEQHAQVLTQAVINQLQTAIEEDAGNTTQASEQIEKLAAIIQKHEDTLSQLSQQSQQQTKALDKIVGHLNNTNTTNTGSNSAGNEFIEHFTSYADHLEKRTTDTIVSKHMLIKSTYDFIIIGGGTAGNVLANRLSSNKAVNVLVIEAGGSDVGDIGIEVPFLGTSLPNTPIDWNYTTTTQLGAGLREIHYTRGKVLGGSSCLNLLTWNICSNDLWNHWASLTGDSGWAWDNVKQYYLKTSSLVPPADGHNDAGEVIPSVHGDGPVDVSVPGFPLPLDSLVINASHQLGGRWTYNEDINAGNGLGTAYMQSSVGGGQRSHAATAYLHPVDNRTNLDILINTQVTRIIRSGTDGRIPAFREVEMAQSSASQRYTVKATKEVLLAAGVFGSPQILQLSGIGPQRVLRSVGITPIVDNNDVGAGLADHPLVPLYYEVNSNATWDNVLRDNNVFNADLAQWMSNRTGLFVDSPGNTQSFFRIPDDDPIWLLYKDPAAGPNSAHMETIYVNAFAPFGTAAPPTTGNYLTLLAALVAPMSRGTVLINSSDPFDHPLIDPSLLTNIFDVYAMVQSIKGAQEFIKAPVFKGYIGSAYGDLAHATTDLQLAVFAAENAVTVNHPSGTCRMSPANSNDGVVDSQLRVKGVSGLRVVDASIFPSVPNCHIQAIVYTVAERAADLIMTAYGL
ncbi:hypothetical protein NM688_g3411 [Phlebia brevispora]|uniref:Uncharacterized protein n=1 Tax=Phlebia brevispora TaxID=194682 RepID=A0ACC1T5V6_9APHY|nr:hypothetical protein NM688_g3411 [Phlebia brevispora]